MWLTSLYADPVFNIPYVTIPDALDIDMYLAGVREGSVVPSWAAERWSVLVHRRRGRTFGQQAAL